MWTDTHDPSSGELASWGGQLRPKHLTGDKAYSYRQVFAYLRRRRIGPVILPLGSFDGRPHRHVDPSARTEFSMRLPLALLIAPAAPAFAQELPGGTYALQIDGEVGRAAVVGRLARISIGGPGGAGSVTGVLASEAPDAWEINLDTDAGLCTVAITRQGSGYALGEANCGCFHGASCSFLWLHDPDRRPLRCICHARDLRVLQAWGEDGDPGRPEPDGPLRGTRGRGLRARDGRGAGAAFMSPMGRKTILRGTARAASPPLAQPPRHAGCGQTVPG